MTRKRRISEALVACNARDPLNLKAVATNEEATANVPTDAELCVSDTAGDGFFHGSNLPLPKNLEDFKGRHDLLPGNKSLPAFTTPPRLIRPLVARNPKDPLDLFSSVQCDRHSAELTGAPTSPTPLHPGVISTSNSILVAETVIKPTNTRKRRRYKSAVLTATGLDFQSSKDGRPVDLSSLNNTKGADLTNVATADVLPTEKAPKKPRSSQRRKRKRRHGTKKGISQTSSVNVTEKHVTEGKQSRSVKTPNFTTSKQGITSHIASDSLASLCASIRPLFAGSSILHIGACGDNGSFSMHAAVNYGADRVVGVDRSMKRIKTARRMLGSYVGQLTLTQEKAGIDVPVFPRSFPACFGPVGPDPRNPVAHRILRSIEFSYVNDYANIAGNVLSDGESSSNLWDTVVLQESVISSVLCNRANGPNAIHRLLTRISSSLRPGGHLLLVLGRLRWQKQLKQYRSPLQLPSHPPQADSTSVSPPDSVDISAPARMHPLTQLRKYFRFRLVRRITPSLSLTRLRRPSSVSWRGASPYLSRHSRQHTQNHVRCQSAAMMSHSAYTNPGYSSANGGDIRSSRRHGGGGHRIVFVLQKKSIDTARKMQKPPREQSTEDCPSTSLPV